MHGCNRIAMLMLMLMLMLMIMMIVLRSCSLVERLRTRLTLIKLPWPIVVCTVEAHLLLVILLIIILLLCQEGGFDGGGGRMSRSS